MFNSCNIVRLVIAARGQDALGAERGAEGPAARRASLLIKEIIIIIIVIIII